MPLVTILIPTFNRAYLLKDALQSAVSQTHQELEILILDDASPDATCTVADRFSHDPRVRYICHTNNLGIAGNWRAGIESARGEFFCLLHDDDTFDPTFVETLLRPLQNDSSLILAFCDHWVMDADGVRLLGATDEARQRFCRTALSEGVLTDFAQSALIDNSLPGGATLFRKSMIASDFITEQAKGSIDAWLFYRCVKTGYAAYYIPEKLMNYRAHSGGMSASMPLHMAEGHLFRYKEILLDASLTRLHPKIKQQMAETLTAYGIALLASSKRFDAREALKQAMCISVSRRTAVAYALACGGPVGTRIAARLRQLTH